MRNLDKVIGVTIIGVVAIAGYELVKGTIRVIKHKKALKGIEEELNKVDEMVDQVEELVK